MHPTNAPVFEMTCCTLLDPKGVSSGLSTVFLKHTSLASVTKPAPLQRQVYSGWFNGPIHHIYRSIRYQSLLPSCNERKMKGEWRHGRRKGKGESHIRPDGTY